jgi:protein-disulfide isomerase
MARLGRRRGAFLAVGMGLAIGAALIAASLLSSRSGATSEPPSAPAETLTAVAEVTAMLEGIPQDGTALGRPDAPVTLVEYADLQCPYCAQWALGALPTLVEEYVRAGKLRIEFRGLAFIGPDSETALRTALAAGRQNRLWHAVELLYANQGAENAGWVTEDLIARLTASVPGLNLDHVTTDRRSAAVTDQIATAQAQAEASNVRGTPAFELGRTGRALRPLQVTSLEPAQFRDAVEAVLAR